jgi:hypothetical protein
LSHHLHFLATVKLTHMPPGPLSRTRHGRGGRDPLPGWEIAAREREETRSPAGRWQRERGNWVKRQALPCATRWAAPMPGVRARGTKLDDIRDERADAAAWSSI